MWGRCALVLSVFAALATPAAVRAQVQFIERGAEPVFGVHEQTIGGSDLGTGDLDGDGAVDLVTPNGIVLRNHGGFFEPDDPAATALPAGVVVFDADGDGDLDVASCFVPLAGATTALHLFLNDGTGRLTDMGPPNVPSYVPMRTDLHAVDIDGDGDLDVVGAHLFGMTILQNVGGARFVDVTSQSLPTLGLVSAVATIDVDGDGDVDLVTRTGDLLANNGSGVFSLVANAGLTGEPVYAPARVLAGDIDGDGDPDVVMGSDVWLNGGGTFTHGAALPGPAAGMSACALADFDADGDLDLVMGGYPGSIPGSPSTALLLRNDGLGNFGNATTLPLLADHANTSAGVVLDTDGDRDLDLVLLGRSATAQLLRNDGSGTFALANRARIPSLDFVYAATPGDFDGDGDTDFITALEFVRNDGDGEFAVDTAGRFPPGLSSIAEFIFSRWQAVGDVDGDGDLDLVLSNYDPLNGNSERLLLNRGNGTFVDATAGRLADSSSSQPELADLDGDGDLDLVIAGAPDRILLNDGTGRFVPLAGAVPTLSGTPVAVRLLMVLADVDGDGDPDLIRFGSPSHVLANDGTGRFTVLATAPAAEPWTAEAGDVDGDGSRDLMLDHALWINSGTGTFTDQTASRMPALGIPSATEGAHLADLDDDGDLDVIHGSDNSDPMILVNDGTGHFVDATASRTFPESSVVRSTRFGVSRSSVVTDIDDDGDPDVVWAAPARPGYTTPYARVVINHHRQLTSPGEPVPGGTYTLIVDSEPGYSTATRFAATLVATGPASLALPGIGVIGIDPSTAVPLPIVSFAPGVGERRLALPVPNIPSLRGGSLWAQALILDGRLQLRLTNTVHDTIR